jgi:beta-mannosidase
MKNIRKAAMAFILFCLGFNLAAVAQTAKISINDGWEFHEYKGSTPNMGEWRNATVPGLIHTDLLAHQLIPDPFYRDNEKKVKWVENSEWEYRKTITAGEAMLKHKNIELVFEGLNTLADVYLNGKDILKTDNMFREWRVDIKPFLKPGNNTLSIVFHRIKPEIDRLDKKYPENQSGLDTSNALVKSFAAGLKQGSYIRKAAYEKGWDWGPSMITCGIWRPAYIQTWDNQKISDFGIVQNDVSKDAAHINAAVQVYSMVKTDAVLKLAYSFSGKKTQVSYPTTLHVGVNEISYPLTIPAPALWYPHGYGPQNLYQFKASVITNNKIADVAATRSGLRSVRLNTDTDGHGRKFEFVVNGIPVFAKGANVIPFDHFPTRVTTQKYRHFLEAAVNANMNMVRLWGGGYYETDEFYNLCDEMGIMVWQDFMFANAIPPAFLRDNVAKEADHQVRRLRNHPCIALWCGNNEILITMETDLGAIPDVFKPYLELLVPKTPPAYIGYMTYFNDLIPNIVKGLSPEMSYTSSSPTANFEPQGPNYDSGDRHNYDVWWNNKPIEDQATYKSRFVSETGIQGFPDMATIEDFTLPDDRTVKSPVMNAHQKNNILNGNTVIAKIIKTEYNEPADFASFVYTSQLLQAESLKIYAESMRRRRPYSMGFLYWQLNDSWPVISWATMDSYGRPKASLYFAKHFFAPLLVSPIQEDGKINVYVVSDLTTASTATLQVRLMDFSGKILFDKKIDTEIKPLSSSVAAIISQKELDDAGYDPSKCFISVKLMKGGETLSSNSLFFKRPKDLNFPKATVQSSLVKKVDHYELTLSSPVLARAVAVSFGKEDAELSDNYVDVLPGETVVVMVKSKASLGQLQSAMKVMALNQ